MQHLSASPPPLREVRSDLSPTLEEVVLRALAKEPKHRFACVQDFATALQRAAQPGVSPRPSGRVPVTSVQEPHFSEPLATASSASSLEPEERSHSKPEPMWNMPAFPTPFLGREQEVASICALLQQAEVRPVKLPCSPVPA
jgi:hypothetical protein